MTSKRLIKINFDGITKTMFADGNKVSKTTVMDVFGLEKGSLSCKSQGNEVHLQTDLLNFILEDKIDD